MILFEMISFFIQRLCPETRRVSSFHRGQTNIFNSSLPSTTDSAPFDYIDEDGGSVIALRRRKRDDNDEEKTKHKLARLISDLTWSMDQSLSTNLFQNNNPSSYYEIRQVQQQFTIETPLSQPAHKHKTAYGKQNISWILFSILLFLLRSSLWSNIISNTRCCRTINCYCYDFNYIYYWYINFIICSLSNMLY